MLGEPRAGVIVVLPGVQVELESWSSVPVT